MIRVNTGHERVDWAGESWWWQCVGPCLLGRCHMTRVDTVQTCVQRSAGADWSSSDLQQFREKLSSRHSDQVVTIILSSVTNQHWDKRGDSVLTWPGNECQTKVQKYFINKWRKIFCYLRVEQQQPSVSFPLIQNLATLCCWADQPVNKH